jgi:acyl-CoA synthetase (NDP forming)
LAVSAADASADNGLRLAQLSPETHASLAAVVPPTGTSLRNPIDVSLTASLEIGIYIQSIQAVVADPAVDAIVIIGAWLNPEANRLYTDAIIETRRQSGKAILMVKLPGIDSPYIPQFCDAGIPYFESSERALRTYARVRRYQQWRKERR